jgi:hypothetical protein
MCALASSQMSIGIAPTLWRAPSRRASGNCRRSARRVSLAYVPGVEHFTTTVALVGIVIIVASLLSGALERTGAPLVAVFIALGAVLGPAGLGLADIQLDSPVLRNLAILALALVLFSDAVTIETSEVRARKRLVWRMVGPGTLVPAAFMALAAWALLDIPAPAAAILGAALASRRARTTSFSCRSSCWRCSLSRQARRGGRSAAAR